MRPIRSISLDLCLVGHPYAPTGRGEDVRCSYRALRSVAVKPAITDIYKLQSPDIDELTEFALAHSEVAAAINIYHINADEVTQAMAHLSYREPWGGYKIIYPAWELGRFPKEWALQLDRFDEIWAPSQFVKESIESECQRPVFHMPLACEVVLSSFLSRRYFGIPESDYVFLFVFDMHSYIQRKNPEAVIKAFRRLLLLRPSLKVRLILKIRGSETAQDAMDRLRESLNDISSHVTVITREMSDNEVKNLVRCCDCFLSLHRSEGYGRGMAEAMCLSKAVIATAYSGNMDFMSGNTALLVPFELVSVEPDAYPYWQDQMWANPDVDIASQYMAKLVDDPGFGRELGARACRQMRVHSSYRTLGLRYIQRLEAIQG
jgi:glycosyltransferase involved in cell wall biosynthesis